MFDHGVGKPPQAQKLRREIALAIDGEIGQELADHRRELVSMTAEAGAEKKAAAGLTSWDDEFFSDDLRHTIRIWPHLNDTGGFYIALLEKIGETFFINEIRHTCDDPHLN